LEAAMKELVACDETTIDALRTRLKQARTIAEFQRIQCVLLRAALGCSAGEIAQVLGWARATVHITHSRWAKEGDAFFDLKGKGGRHNCNLTEQEEAEVLAPFMAQATAGGVLKVAEIQQAYEARLGKAVPNSTIYRMLARHHWRKVVPRPRHPKADVAARGAFKKSSAGSCVGKSVAKPLANAVSG
jgi:transposase